MKHETFCKSESRVDVPILHITDWNPEFGDILKLEKRPLIYIIARQHPSESPGSFMVEGFINYLASKDQSVALIRKLFRFRIIPMVNVDGVIVGNFRTNLSGDDLNRSFQKTNKAFHPVVFALKNMIEEDYAKGESVMAFYDLHGHSARRNVFIYGPAVSLTDELALRAKTYAYMLSKKTKMFKYGYCLWRLSKCKKSTARAFMLQKLQSR